MGRHVDVDLLVGSVEIARRLGMKRPQVVHDWRRRYPAFPAPVAHLSQALIWYWPDVERWATQTGRRPIEADPGAGEDGRAAAARSPRP